MKKEDQQKINKALSEISKLEFSRNVNDDQKGMANMAKAVLAVFQHHPNSKQYRYALRNLIERGTNAKKSLETI